MSAKRTTTKGTTKKPAPKAKKPAPKTKKPAPKAKQAKPAKATAAPKGKLTRIVDPSTDVTFVELPGGTLEIGLRKNERTQLLEVVRHDRALASWPAPTKVKVAPFRVSIAPLSGEVVAPLAGEWESYGSQAAHVSAADAATIVAKLGYRLLTDAEWEYVARSGGVTSWASKPSKKFTGYKANAFGVQDLGYGTWLAPTKGKQPSLASAGGARSWPWQSAEEAVLVHAAYREPAKLAPLLVAWDATPEQIAKAKPAGKPAAWKGDTHVPTGLRFVDVPGGTFEMGLSDAERARIEALLLPEHKAAFAEVASHCPLRTVTVAPFRVATAPLSAEQSKRLGTPCNLFGGYAEVPVEKIRAWATKFGFRMLSEAEWEYLLRDGGTRGWGDDLIALLERIPDPEKEAPPYSNKFGIEGFVGGSVVDDGAAARASASRDSGYPREADTYIERLWRKPGWVGVLFALP